jgi:hypothetical protein
MMRWLLEHIQIVIAVAGVIAYWLNQRQREKQGLPADYDEDGIPENRPVSSEFDPSTMELDEAERTRRVMEELRRKRAERLGEAIPTPSPAVSQTQSMPPVVEDPLAQAMQDMARRFGLPADAQPERPASRVADEEVLLERQRELAEKMRLLDAERVITERRAASVAATQAVYHVEAGAHSYRDYTSALGDPVALRQAIVLNEILSRPVSLR